MNTDDLIKWGEEEVTNYSLRDKKKPKLSLQCAQVYALLAIANELKRFNDDLADAGLTDNQRQWLESIG
jgi:hypothetical protein